jgi:hypothetical protein
MRPVHRSLSEPSPLFDYPRYKELVLLGGDLNGPKWPASNQFLERNRIEAGGLGRGGDLPGRRERQALRAPERADLLHQPHGGVEGQAVDIEIQAKEMIRNRELMNEIIAKHTGQPMERVSKDTDRDFILIAEQAVEYGAVDEIITSRTIRPGLAVAAPGGS